MPSVEWNDAETEFLISERRRRNISYHNIIGRSRSEFWESVSRRIRRRFGTHFTAQQCQQKWRNLVRDFYNFADWRNGIRNARWSRSGERHYRLFRTRFWDRPANHHSRRRHRNTAHRRPRR